MGFVGWLTPVRSERIQQRQVYHVVARRARFSGRQRKRKARNKFRKSVFFERRRCYNVRFLTKYRKIQSRSIRVLCAPIQKNSLRTNRDLRIPVDDPCCRAPGSRRFAPQEAACFRSDTLLGGYKRAHQARRSKKNSSDMSLTQAVIQHVKMARNKGIGIQDLLGIVAKLNPESSLSPRTKTPKPKRKTFASAQAPQSPSPQSPVHKVWTAHGRSRPYFEDPATGWWWWADASSDTTEQRTVRQKTSSPSEPTSEPQLPKVVAAHQAE